MTDATTPIEPAALNVEEAARYLGGISADWLARSDCPRVRFGRRVVFLVSDLRAFAVQRRTHGMEAA